MALIVEDGTVVSNASSFVTLGEARAYASVRGVSLPVDDATVEVLAIKAMDYLVSVEPRFQGVRVSADQVLPFPRSGVTLNGFELGEDSIPPALKQAQCQLIVDAHELGDLQVNSANGRELLRDKVDVIEQEFAETGNSAPQPVLVKALAILQPLFTSSGFTLDVRRV